MDKNVLNLINVIIDIKKVSNFELLTFKPEEGWYQLSFLTYDKSSHYRKFLVDYRTDFHAVKVYECKPKFNDPVKNSYTEKLQEEIEHELRWI